MGDPNTQGEKAAARSVVITPSGKSRQFESGGRSVTFVPLSIKRRHRTKLIVPPDGETGAKTTTSMDLPLVRTLGKAFYWERLIESGEVPNATELARLFKLEAGWVSEVLRMTLLAPDIVRAILEGRQPRHLNLHAVRGRQKEVPPDWEEQRKLLGSCFSSDLSLLRQRFSTCGHILHVRICAGGRRATSVPQAAYRALKSYTTSRHIKAPSHFPGADV